MPKSIKPMASDYPLTGKAGLVSYIADKRQYAIEQGKNPNKVAMHYYKEAGIYCVQDLLDHRTDNPWSRIDL